MSEKGPLRARLARGGGTPLDDILNDALRRELVKGLLQILEVKRGLFAGDPDSSLSFSYEGGRRRGQH